MRPSFVSVHRDAAQMNATIGLLDRLAYWAPCASLALFLLDCVVAPSGVRILAGLYPMLAPVTAPLMLCNFVEMALGPDDSMWASCMSLILMLITRAVLTVFRPRQGIFGSINTWTRTPTVFRDISLLVAFASSALRILVYLLRQLVHMRASHEEEKPHIQ